MSGSRTNGVVVVEWSPGLVRRFDPVRDEWTTGKAICDVVASGQSVVIAPSRRVTYLKSARVPNVSPGEVRRVLDVQLSQLLPISGTSAASDFRLTSDVDSEGRLAVVCAVRAELIEEIFAEAKSAGVNVVRVVPAAFGSFALAKEQGLSDCTVIEQTPDGLAIDVVSDGELRYSRVAASVKTESEIEAELKRTAAVAGASSDYTLAAGGLPAANVAKNVRTPSLTALTGPALEQIGISLEPPSLVAMRESRQKSSRMRLAILSMVAAAVMWLFVYFQYDDANKKAREIVKKREATMKSLTSAQTAARNRVTSLTKMEAQIVNAFQPAQTPSDVATIVSQCTPQGLWLTGFVFERGKPLQLRGAAMQSGQVTQFVDQLGETGRFRDLKIQFINDAQVDLTKVVQFSATAHVIGNLPVSEKSSKGK